MTSLQVARKSRGMTQRELADQSGISIRTIQCYEQGSIDCSAIGVHAMLRMALVLDCGLSSLLDGDAKETAEEWEIGFLLQNK